MTSTTIGLGDLAPQTQAGRVYGIAHMVLSVTLLGSIVGTVLDGLSRRKASMEREALLAKQADAQLLASLDKDGDGVDKAEFVLGMLEKLDVVSEEQYAPFLKQFERLDTSGDGKLSRDDLTALARQNQAQQAADAELEPRFCTMVRGHAIDLAVPTMIAAFGFTWNTAFGFTLLAAGLLHGLAIGVCIGSPLTKREDFHRVAQLIALGMACFIASVALLIFYAVDPKGFFELDYLQRLQAEYHGLADGLVFYGEYRWEDSDNDFQDKPAFVAIQVLYILCFVYAILNDIICIICCFKASAERKQLDQAKRVHILITESVTS